MYDQDMGKMSGEPNGAALTTPKDWDELPYSGSITGWVGKNGAKCFFLEIFYDQI